MRAPCDSPVRSYRTDLCGTSQLSVAPLIEPMASVHACVQVSQLIMVADVDTQAGVERKALRKERGGA